MDVCHVFKVFKVNGLVLMEVSILKRVDGGHIRICQANPLYVVFLSIIITEHTLLKAVGSGLFTFTWKIPLSPCLSSSLS